VPGGRHREDPKSPRDAHMTRRDHMPQVARCMARVSSATCKRPTPTGDAACRPVAGPRRRPRTGLRMRSYAAASSALHRARAGSPTRHCGRLGYPLCERRAARMGMSGARECSLSIARLEGGEDAQDVEEEVDDVEIERDGGVHVLVRREPLGDLVDIVDYVEREEECAADGHRKVHAG